MSALHESGAEASLFSIEESDVQMIAIQRIGRELTLEELRATGDGLKWGFEGWEIVVGYAIDAALER